MYPHEGTIFGKQVFMPRKPSVSLTEAEQKVMLILWEAGKASVRDVHEQLNQKKKLAYTTVLTILKILADKGYAGYEKEGRAFIYYPLISQAEARQKALSNLVTRFFGGSSQALAQHLVEIEGIDLEDLAELRRELSEHETEQN